MTSEEEMARRKQHEINGYTLKWSRILMGDWSNVWAVSRKGEMSRYFLTFADAREAALKGPPLSGGSVVI